jgi:hypothetical protein
MQGRLGSCHGKLSSFHNGKNDGGIFEVETFILVASALVLFYEIHIINL